MGHIITKTSLYSIAYATKPIEVFIQQLLHYKINVIADVRSVPYSKVFHHYHKEAIAQRLKQAGIQYVYLGEELGPRSKDPKHYNPQGQVQFKRIMQSPLFIHGIKRLQTGLNKGYRIALMCAEKDPATCHRSLLLGHPLLKEYQLNVQHIDHQGDIENQQQLEQRLVDIHNLTHDLFMSEEEKYEHAYHQQHEQYAYIKPDE